jgi:hypothetical protein
LLINNVIADQQRRCAWSAVGSHGKLPSDGHLTPATFKVSKSNAMGTGNGWLPEPAPGSPEDPRACG